MGNYVAKRHAGRISITEQVSVAVTLHTCIWDMLDSILGWDINGYPHRDVSLFSSVPPDKCRYTTSNRP
jgi:hypothetical protein